MTTTTTRVRRAGVVFGRVVQAGLAGFAGLLVVGSLLADMGILPFLVVGVVTLILLGFVGVVELGVRVVRE